VRITEESYITIIGAGPSGSHLARRLSEAGFGRITFIDPKAPWAKPCAGGLPGRTLKKFPFLDSGGLQYTLVEAVNYSGPAGEMIRFELQSPQRNYIRHDLNGFFLEKAVGAGAALLRERITDITGSAGGWEIRHTGGSHKAEFVVGADGVFGITRRKVHSPFGRENLSVSVDAIVPREEHGGTDGSDDVDLVFIPDINGYAWRFPLPGHDSVGFCAASGLMPGKKMRDLLARISEKNFGIALGKAEISGYAIPSLGRKELRNWTVTGPGWALTGDASGAADPTTREGLFYAVQTAEILGESIMEGNPLAYQDRWSSMIGRELSASAHVSKFFFSTTSQNMIVSAGRRSLTMKALLAGLLSGDQEYRTLLKTLSSSSVRILLELAGSLLRGGLHAGNL